MAKRAWKYWEPAFEADGVCPMHPVWPWGGHRRFAYDLVRWMRPARIGELGVHWGTSFFAFAQAVKDGRMPGTELVGVDTFEGEDHAGRYGPEVFETVQRVVREHFARQTITLHKMFFRDALAHVEDGSLDLLHIDGLHTFEAVKDDFESWLPKVAPEGVVLFHDVASDTGYGSTEYWKQLSAEHPGFAFEHSWGLGVLFPKGDARLRDLGRQGLEEKLLLYPALARAERAGHEVRDLGEMAKRRLEALEKQHEVNAELRQQLAEVRRAPADAGVVERLTARLLAAEALAVERYEIMQKQTGLIRTRDDDLERLRARLDAASAMAVERLEAIKQANARLGAVQAAVAKTEVRAAAAEAARDELRARVRSQEEQGAEQRRGADAAREQQAALREKLAAAETELAILRRQAAESAAAVRRSLDDMAAHLAAMLGAQQRRGEESAARLAELSGAFEGARRAVAAAAELMSRRIGRLDTDAELLSMRAEHLESVVSGLRERGPEQAEAAEDWLTGRARGEQERSPRRS
ncbi:MAG: class I SAM-dependent methyltransferase [Phycisphaerales bacterium]|nr:class I SAM-dependent methyltransferase [Phycisphaerales bacterium]